jgi:hypothetical protein
MARRAGPTFLILSAGSLCALCLSGQSLSAVSQAEAVKIKETEYDAGYAAVVKAYEAAEKKSAEDPAAALKGLEEQVLPKLPKVYEAVLSVRFVGGAAVGAERESHSFFPYRLAGRCALAAGDPERAVIYLEKSPSSAALLADARRAAKERQARVPAPAPPPLQKPALDLAPLLAANDYAGALRKLDAGRETIGKDYEARVAEVRRAASDHANRCSRDVARVLPRLMEDKFHEENVEPCFASCRNVPPDLETEELRWIRRLGEWLKKRTVGAFERLALDAAKFDDDYHVVCRKAQEDRVAEARRLVDEARQASKTERPGVLARLDAAKRAFKALAAAKEYKELAEELARQEERLPVDDEALDRARAGAATVADVRMRADELERLWASDRRAKLGVQDQSDLAVYLAIYRASALFLEGKQVEEVAADRLVAELFHGAKALPAGISPKVRRVHERVNAPK